MLQKAEEISGNKFLFASRLRLLPDPSRFV